MNKKMGINTFKVLCVIFIAALIFSTTNNVYADKSPIEVNFSYGFEWKYKTGHEIPIELEIQNNGGDIEGIIEVEVPTNHPNKCILLSKEVNLPKGSKKIIHMDVPTRSYKASYEISVKITSDKKQLFEETFIISKGRVRQGKILVGVLSDDFNGLNYFGDVKGKLEFIERNQRTYGEEKGNLGIYETLQIVRIDEDTIRDNISSIEALDMIIINNYDTSKISAEQYETLKGWVNEGKTLILGTGVNSQKTLSLFKDDFINGSIKEVSQITTDQVSKKIGQEEVLTIDSVQLELKGDKPILQEGDHTLITKVNKGGGNIIIASFDLGSEPITSYKGNAQLWEEILKELNIVEYNSDEIITNYTLDEFFRSVIDFKAPSINVLILIFIAYILIVSPISYFVLKKLNKRILLWITIPSISIIFGFIVYFAGSPTRVTDVITSKFNLINIDKEGNSKINSYVAIIPPKKSDLVIEETENRKLNYLFEDYYSSGNNKGKREVELKEYDKDNKTYYELSSVEPFSNRIFEVKGVTENVGTIESDIKFSGESYEGTIKNCFNGDLDKVFIINTSEIIELTDVKKSESVDIKEGKRYSRFREILNHYYDKDNRNSDDYKIISSLRLYEDIEAVNEKSNIILAIGKIPVNYNIKVNGKSTKEYEVSFIEVPFKVNFENEQGISEYPYNHFLPNIINDNGQLEFNVRREMAWGIGEGELSYEFEENLIVEELKIKDISDRYTNEKFEGEYYIFNYETNEYQELEIAGTELVLKDIKKYLSGKVVGHNKIVESIKIKIKNDSSTKKELAIPQIAVSGRKI